MNPNLFVAAARKSAALIHARTVRLYASSIILLLVFAFQSVSRADRVVLVAGGGTDKTGIATNCALRSPFAVDFDRGNMYIAEMAGGERVLKVDRRGVLTIFAGTGEKGDIGDGGPATEAKFNGMHHLAVGPNDDVFVTDTFNSRVRRVDAKTGSVFPFAGSGKRGFAGDGGPAAAAEFGNVYCLAFDPNRENVFVDDLDNHRIRVVNLKTTIVTTAAGNGQHGVPHDGGRALDEPLVDPRAITVDSRGNLYILERSGNTLRMVDRNGAIHTVAGTGKKGAQDGEALAASFSGPKHLCMDRSDNVIIADTDNHVIRKYLPKEKRVITIVGVGKVGSGGIGGPAASVELNQPHGVFVDNAGTLFIADSLNNRVLKILQ
jgi:DNA-binding beta-propeller fold protein YncE